MANNNPFTYGNPISNPRRFFGREHETELIFSRLRNAEFESSSLVGERRIGKTSLLNYLADVDVRRRYDLLGGTHMFVYVDLQMMNQDVTPVRLWQRLLRQMGRVCQDPIVHQAIDEIRAAMGANRDAGRDVPWPDNSVAELAMRLAPAQTGPARPPRGRSWPNWCGWH